MWARSGGDKQGSPLMPITTCNSLTSSLYITVHRTSPASTSSIPAARRPHSGHRSARKVDSRIRSKSSSPENRPSIPHHARTEDAAARNLQRESITQGSMEHSAPLDSEESSLELLAEMGGVWKWSVGLLLPSWLRQQHCYCQNTGQRN